MASDHEHTEFDGHVVTRKGLGILFHINDLGEDVWFPAAQVELSDDESSILVPNWLVQNKGL